MPVFCGFLSLFLLKFLHLQYRSFTKQFLMPKSCSLALAIALALVSLSVFPLDFSAWQKFRLGKSSRNSRSIYLDDSIVLVKSPPR